MANTGKGYVTEYIDDFGKTWENLSYKFEINPNIPLGSNNPVTPPRRPVCGAARYFSMRKVKPVFIDGTSTEIPVANLASVKSEVNRLAQLDGIACIGVIGEKWKIIPPGLLGGNYASDGLDGVEKPLSTSVKYQYLLDGNDPIVRVVSIESEPEELFLAQTKCLDIVQTQQTIPCALAKGFKPRMFKGIRLNTATDGRFGRQIIVSSNTPADIKKCGADVMGAFNCLGYTGETIENALEWYSATSAGGGGTGGGTP